jgi:hypothetical protein
VKDMIRSMLRQISTFPIDTTKLNKGIDEFNKTAYDFITNLHSTAVLPITSVIISIILVLELARTASHMEGDHQLGVKIIAATMFKSALLVVAAQNSTLFLKAINEVSTKIITGIGITNTDYGPKTSDTLEKQIIPLVSNLDTGDQAGMLMMLLIPYLLVKAAEIIIYVMIFFRFAELYAMTAFSSLPIAFLGHPDTKSMGINYLQKYAAVSLQGATLMLAVAVYNALISSFVNDFRVIGKNANLAAWTFSHYRDFIIAPILLIILILSSGKLAKALVGQ